ncbi:MAG: HupE/UreJ family protein [Alphaproteobacteria bacterium]|nr:HupE/UreJ family protein [Alphaproteobacteria bacterium]
MISALLLGAVAWGHALEPSLLELDARDPARVQVTWKRPFAEGSPLPLDVLLPPGCAATGPVTVDESTTVRTERWTADCGAAFSGQLSVLGLERTGGDVIFRYQDSEQRHHAVLTPAAPSWSRPQGAASGSPSALRLYLPIGVEHILEGADHLAFVLGLVLLVGRRARALLLAITGFTLAHSLTLALASLDVVRAPSAVVEACIAGSVLLLAVELARPADAPPTWTHRHPALVSMACGLLHGLGFAGALAELGLPQDDLLGALLGFNLGVEAGQLTVVAGLLALGAAARALRLTAQRPLVYALGAVAAMWTLARGWAVLIG